MSYGPKRRDLASPFWRTRRRIDARIHSEPVLCWICGAPCQGARVTCSDGCHEKLVNRLERELGRFKKVVDLETGKAHKVSTREIIEKGLKQQDLKNQPEWREG